MVKLNVSDFHFALRYNVPTITNHLIQYSRALFDLETENKIYNGY